MKDHLHKISGNVVLGSVCSIDKSKHDGSAATYVGLEDISSRTGEFWGSRDPATVKSATFRFDDRHVLYGRLRPYLNKALTPNFAGHCSSEIFPLLPNDQLDRRYLFHWLTSDQNCRSIDATSTGARMPRANMNAVLDFKIPLPPISEQRRIVAVLDKAFKRLDRARANADANLQNAQDILRNFLIACFAKGAGIWSSRSLSEIAENLDRRRVPITKKDRVAGEVPYYGASGVVDYVADFIFDEDLLLISEDGANLLARTYPIAFSISGKSWVNNHAHVLRFSDPDTQEYVRLYLNSISLEPYVSGMAQPKLNQTALNQIPISYPDRETRTQIVSKAAVLSSATDKLADFYKTTIKDVLELRQSLLQRAFAGELI